MRLSRSGRDESRWQGRMAVVSWPLSFLPNAVFDRAKAAAVTVLKLVPLDIGQHVSLYAVATMVLEVWLNLIQEIRTVLGIGTEALLKAAAIRPPRPRSALTPY